MATTTKKTWARYRPYSPTLKIYLLRRKTVDPVTGCWNWTASFNGTGYGQCGGGNSRWFREYRKQLAHQLSYLRFCVPVLGPMPEGTIVCHHCDNRKCINPAHLYAGTYQDNSDDMVRRGRGRSGCVYGTANGQSKLNDQKVRDIRRLAKEGLNYSQLSEMFDISKTTICAVVRGRCWKHVQ